MPTPVALPRLTVSSAGVVQRAGQPFRAAGANVFQLVNNDYPNKAGRLMTHAEIDSLLDKAVALKLGVVRALTLGQNIGSTSAHLVAGITGTTSPVITYRSAVWEVMDYAIKAATDRGLYLVTTLTGEPGSYHGSKRDWVNYRRPGTCSTDLSVNSANTPAERDAEDFFYSDTQIGVTDFRTFTRDFLLHVNTYTGRAYKDESSLNLQSGNEMWTADRFRTWQTSWADYVKTIAPDTLILDGMGADLSSYWATQPGGDAIEHIITTEALANQSIKVHTLHPYSVATAADVTEAARRCAQAGKALAVDEYGWSKANAADIEAAVRAAPNAFFSAWWSLQNDADLHNGGPGVGYGTDDASLYVPGADSTQTAAITRLLAHSTAMTTAGVPDLVVTSLTSSPTNPAAGDSVTFSGVVKNQGTATTPAGTVVGLAFSIDGTLVNWSDTSATALAAGASRTLTANGGPNGTATWVATGGTHSLTAVVDDVNRITESDETNNASATTTVTVTGSGGGTATVQPGAGVMTTSSNPVRRAREKTDSIGVATHLTYPAYADLAQVVAKLQYVNINHLRDGWGTGRGSIVTYLLNNYPSARLCMVLDANDWSGNASTQTGGVSASAQVAEFQSTGLMPLVEYVEGPNERDSIATAAANYFAPRAAAFKAAGVKVGTPSMAQVNPKSPYDAMASVLQDQVDVVTHHPYPGSDSMMNSTILNTLTTNSRSFFSTAKLALTDPIPMIFTETGFATSANGDQGKSMPPTGPFAHQHLRIWSKSFLGLPGKMYAARVYKYELIDQGAADVESTFGLFDSSGNPKPVATAIRNSQMLEMDNDPAALTFTPVDVPGITITGTNSGTDVLKLQKANGEWWYEIWQNDVTFATTGARTEVHPSGVNVTLSWTGSRSVSVYRPTSSQTATQTATGSSITVTSSYDPIYLRIV